MPKALILLPLPLVGVLALMSGCALLPGEKILVSRDDHGAGEVTVARIPHPPDYDLRVTVRADGKTKSKYFSRDGAPTRAFAV